jgi:hypothetical protein
MLMNPSGGRIASESFCSKKELKEKCARHWWCTSLILANLEVEIGSVV